MMNWGEVLVTVLLSIMAGVCVHQLLKKHRSTCFVTNMEELPTPRPATR
jgi:hypothetical protein